MYACMSTRPDICTAVNVYSQFQAYATEKHYKGVRRIIKYLKGTVNWGLWFKGLSEIPLTLYADADFANDPDRKSISGFVIEMHGDPVAWGTRKQKHAWPNQQQKLNILLWPLVCPNYCGFDNWSKN